MVVVGAITTIEEMMIDTMIGVVGGREVEVLLVTEGVVEAEIIGAQIEKVASREGLRLSNGIGKGKRLNLPARMMKVKMRIPIPFTIAMILISRIYHHSSSSSSMMMMVMTTDTLHCVVC